MTSKRVLVIGAGISGIACANALVARGFEVEVRDRGRAVGGRMASRRLRDTGTAYDGHFVDYGASYFTARDEGFLDSLAPLIEHGVVSEWTDAFHVHEPQGMAGVRMGPMRYRAAEGLRNVVQVLSNGLTIHANSAVERLEIHEHGARAHGDEFDAVAVCMPAPQAARLLPSGPEVLEALVWEPVIAVTLVFEERTWGDIDGVFVNDDPVVTWIADDGRRRGDDAPVLVAHTHPVLSAGHLQDPSAVIPAVIATVQRVLGINELPSWVDAHRWTYAKPMTALAEEFWMDDSGHWGLAGDGFADGPRIETAWKSGDSLGRALLG